MKVRIQRQESTPQLGLELCGGVANVPTRPIVLPFLVPISRGLTLEKTLDDYRREHIIANTKAGPERDEKVRRFGYTAKVLLRVLGGHALISSFNRNTGRTYTDKRIEEGVSEAAAERELTVLIAACNHERKEERIEKQFNIWKPPGSAPRVEIVTHEEQAQVWATQKTVRQHRWLVLGYSTGARSTAIEQAKWDRYSRGEGVIDYRLPDVDHKNKRRVICPLNDYAKAEVERWYDERVAGDPYIIGAGQGGICSTTYHGIAKLMKRAGVIKRAPRHVARHTVVTRLLIARVPIAEVAAFVGDRVAMIETTYGHFMPKDLLPAANLLHCVAQLAPNVHTDS